MWHWLLPLKMRIALTREPRQSRYVKARKLTRCTRAHTHTRTHKHTYTHTYIHTHTHTHTYTHIVASLVQGILMLVKPYICMHPSTCTYSTTIIKFLFVFIEQYTTTCTKSSDRRTSWSKTSDRAVHMCTNTLTYSTP